MGKYKKLFVKAFYNWIIAIMVNGINATILYCTDNLSIQWNNAVITMPQSNTIEASTMSYYEIFEKYTPQVTPTYEEESSLVYKYKYGLVTFFKTWLFPISLSELGLLKWLWAVFCYLLHTILVITLSYYSIFFFLSLIWCFIPNKFCRTKVYQKLQTSVLIITVVLLPFYFEFLNKMSSLF